MDLLDIGSEIFRTGFVLGILVYLLWLGRRGPASSRRGWRLMLCGFGLLLFANLIDIADEVESLSRFIIGNTDTQAILEKVIAGPGGYLLLLIGLIRWMPTVQQLSREVERRRQAEQALEAKVAERTADLKATNEALAAEIAVHRQVQEALELTQSRLQHLLTASPAVIYSSEAHGNYAATFISDNVKFVTGHDPQAFLDDPHFWFEHVHPQDRDRILGELSALFRDGQYRYEYRFRHEDGSYRWVHDAMRLVRDAQGQPLEIVGYWIDIHERKQAEQTRNRLSAILEASSDFVGYADPEGRAIYINQAGCEMVGITAEAAVGQPITAFSPGWANTIIYNEGLLEASRSGRWHGETALLNRDGREIPVSQLILVHKSPQGEVEFFSTIARDISERKSYEAQLEYQAGVAQSASRAKSEFLANMSHEIRTPMNAIIGLTDFVLDTGLAPRQRDYLNMVRQSADALLRLLNDILDFSKIEAGKLELEPAPFDLRESTGDTLKTLAVRAHQKGLELAYHIAPDVPEVLVGDAGRLMQVLINLVGNAIKFTERGEVVVHIETVSQTASEACLRVSVTDTGIGIPPEKQRLIFDAFSQGNSSNTRRFGGTGLGLAISSQLVQLMGGGLSVESQVDKGSTFYFMARFGVQTEMLVKPVTGRLEPDDLIDLPVLVVDDNETNRFILSEVLTKWGMRPTAVDGGHAALEALSQAAAAAQPFSLLLLDAVMPEMDGFTLAEQIKQLPEWESARIMMLSSLAHSEDIVRCQSLGIAMYLTKPIKQSELLNAILTALFTPSETPTLPLTARSTKTDVLRPLHILLAEDIEVNQKLMTGLLEKWGHTAVIANNGKEAVAAFEGEPFDLILMDVQMPEMDGFQATAAIRTREQITKQHTPIVALTAHAMKGDRERCLAAGMDAYAAKPLRALELLKVINSLADRSHPVETAVSDKGIPSAPAYDREAALATVGGDVELLEKMIKAFFNQTPKLLTEIGESIARSDPAAVERTAHKLKGSVGNFSAQGAYEAAFKLETLGRNSDLGKAGEAFTQLKLEMVYLQDALDELTEETA